MIYFLPLPLSFAAFTPSFVHFFFLLLCGVGVVMCGRFSKVGAQRGGDAHDPLRLDSRRLHAETLACVRRELSALAEHRHAAAGDNSTIHNRVTLSSQYNIPPLPRQHPLPY